MGKREPITFIAKPFLNKANGQFLITLPRKKFKKMPLLVKVEELIKNI